MQTLGRNFTNLAQLSRYYTAGVAGSLLKFHQLSVSHSISSDQFAKISDSDVGLSAFFAPADLSIRPVDPLLTERSGEAQ
jgi:hypothetical protein